MTALQRIKDAVNTHEPERNVQWYVDEFCIDVDAEEFWQVVERALGGSDD